MGLNVWWVRICALAGVVLLVGMAYMRTVQTSSGVRAVQVVHFTRNGSRRIEHLGSARDEDEVEALKVAASRPLARGKEAFGLGIDLLPERAVAGSEPLPVLSTRMERSITAWRAAAVSRVRIR